MQHSGGALFKGVGNGIQVIADVIKTLTGFVGSGGAGAAPAGAKQKSPIDIDDANGDICKPIQAAHQLLQFWDVGQVRKTVFHVDLRDFFIK